MNRHRRLRIRRTHPYDLSHPWQAHIHAARGRESIDSGNMDSRLPASLMKGESQMDAGYSESRSRHANGKPDGKTVNVRFAAPGWSLLLSDTGGGDAD